MGKHKKPAKKRPSKKKLEGSEKSQERWGAGAKHKTPKPPPMGKGGGGAQKRRAPHIGGRKTTTPQGGQIVGEVKPPRKNLGGPPPAQFGKGQRGGATRKRGGAPGNKTPRNSGGTKRSLKKNTPEERVSIGARGGEGSP